MKKITTAFALLLVLSLSISISSIPTVSATEDSWVTIEPMPTARAGLGIAVVDGKIYAIGGYNGSYLSTNEMYDPETDTWTTKTSMPTPRHSFGIAVYQNNVYVIGGIIGSSDSENSGYTGVTEVYYPETDTWETRTSMPTSRSELSASVVNNKIYLIGGRAYTNKSVPYYNSVSDNEVYDPETDTWSSGTMVSMPRFQLAAGATSGEFAPKRIHILSGDTHPIYDPETDTWTTGTPMPTLRWLFGITVINDELYAIGGYNGTTIFAVNEKYTPINYIPEFPQWTPLLIMLLAIMAVAVIYRRNMHKLNQGRKRQ